jgi:sigma-B regulation protein RsbU (phosphoserine phosphatase)
MSIAREVQARLLPRDCPDLPSLECGRSYAPALGVGGDYHDFLRPTPGRVVLILADISGKGISAALMMSNLQASLRSHYATAVNGLTKLLRSVNQLLCESTAPQFFATLVLADYDLASRRLRYVNCGHTPPLLVRRDGRVERLGATAIPLGMFEDWTCSVDEIELAPGDDLLMYTDGVTETVNDTGDEFGQGRLARALKSQRHVPAPLAVEVIAGACRGFGDGRQRDDMTLVLVRPR